SGPAAAAAAASGEPLTPEQAGSLLITRLWQALPAGVKPSRLVLTAPIEGYRGYRQWLQQLSSLIPVEEVALVDEPTAAAIGAGLPAGSRVLVVDLGGGTIDLSLVALQGGEGRAAPIAQLLRFGGRDLDGGRQALRCAEVIGKAGASLGGRDIDRWIAASLAPDLGEDPALLEISERLKCGLSEAENVTGVWSSAAAGSRSLRLDRTQLDQLLRQRGLLQLLDDLLERVLAAARARGLGLEQIDAVLPVGGTSRLPSIRHWLAERCGPIPVRDQRPVEAVALGALALTPGVRLKDVLARGVSLRCWDQRGREHRWHPLFLAGQSWPTDQPLEMVLSCSRDGQSSLELVLGEPIEEDRSEVVFIDGLPQVRRRPAGEARTEPWSRQPAPVSLDPPGSCGLDRLRLRFSIDTDGQLLLECEDLLGGNPTCTRVLGVVR
ncbi:Hsp70 family protein, partial [Synechococcus sp. CS-1329]|uniref:Hsp70 family protein n=1 Tax=Synechococcus sp. CS-1329 TaxID=2847975 RepID=UPI00223B354F